MVLEILGLIGVAFTLSFILVGLGFSFGLPSDKRREPVEA